MTFHTKDDPKSIVDLYNDREPDLLLEYVGKVGQLEHDYVGRIYKGEGERHEGSKRFLVKILGATPGVQDVQIVQPSRRAKRSQVTSE